MNHYSLNSGLLNVPRSFTVIVNVAPAVMVSISLTMTFINSIVFKYSVSSNNRAWSGVGGQGE